MYNIDANYSYVYFLMRGSITKKLKFIPFIYLRAMYDFSKAHSTLLMSFIVYSKNFLKRYISQYMIKTN